MKRAIFVIVVISLLISLATYESIIVAKILNNLNDSINTILPKYKSNKENITILLDEINQMDSSWEELESPLCLMFNHKDLSTITDGFNKLISYTENNDYDNAIAEINFLQGYCENADHLMGFNIHNIL